MQVRLGRADIATRTALDAWASGLDAPVGFPEARHVSALVAATYLLAERGEAVELAELERVER